MCSLLSCFSIALLFIDRDISLCVLDFKSECRLNICCQKACVCEWVMVMQETEALLSKGLVFVSGVCGALFVPSIYWFVCLCACVCVWARCLVLVVNVLKLPYSICETKGICKRSYQTIACCSMCDNVCDDFTKYIYWINPYDTITLQNLNLCWKDSPLTHVRKRILWILNDMSKCW